MIYVPISNLKPGMKLSADISINGCNYSDAYLLKKKKMLTSNLIDMLKLFNIHGVYIEDGIKNKIEIKRLIDDSLKDEAVSAVKDIFTVCETQRKILDIKNIEQIENISSNLVNKITKAGNTSIGITDLQTYDNNTYYHSLSVTVLSLAIGTGLNMNKDELVELGVSALLHDIGKINIPHSIIDKPSKLTNEEYEIVKSHPEIGGKFVDSNLAITDKIYFGILAHHEKYDGTGYPKGLKGNNIPLFGRIIAVADVYDALTGNRSYRKPIKPSEAIEYVMGGCGTLFDYDIVKAFLKKISPYPVGMSVKLSNNKTAVVIKENHSNPLRPKVKIIGEKHKILDLGSNLKLSNITITDIDYDYLVNPVDK